MLKRGLAALKWAVAMRRMQTDAMATRRRAALLSRCFSRVSNGEGMSVCVTPAQLEAVLKQTSLVRNVNRAAGCHDSSNLTRSSNAR